MRNPKTKDTSNQLEQFVDHLIKDKRIPFSEDKFYRKHHQEMVEYLHTVLRTKLLNRLNPEQKKHFNRFISEGRSDRQIQGYVLSQIPDALTYLTHVLLHFRLHYLAKPHQFTHASSIHVGSSIHHKRSKNI